MDLVLSFTGGKHTRQIISSAMDNTSSPLKLVTSFVKSSEVQIAVVAFITSVLATKLVRKFTSEEKPSPPGPWGFPILGYLPFLDKAPCVSFMKLRENFGDIFQIQMGSWTAVVINGKHFIREALKESRDDFSGRPQFESAKFISDGNSLGFGPYNEKWKILHKLANKVLAEFSSAKKNPIQDIIQEEIYILVNSCISQNGKSFDPSKVINLSVASIIYQICFGQKQNIRNTKDFKAFLERSEEITKLVNAGNAIDSLPWMKYIMPWKLKILANLDQTTITFRNKRVDEHRETFSPDHLRDMTDGLLAASKTETRLTEEIIMVTIDGIFGAGFETVTHTLCWAVKLMAAHPDVQKRVQAEIDDTVGDGRRPGIQDMGKLVYTEAVLHEVNRFVALAPLSIPHSTVRDTQLGGYSIKKDTVVFINLYSMSRDKAVWDDPDVFRPGRFLDKSGQINKSLLEEFLPFSAGNRKCMGESLARTEVFLFFSGLLQTCSILKLPEVTEYSMESQLGLIRQCLAYTIQTKTRN